MTIDATPSLLELVAEYGGALPHQLSEYVRGGAYVRNATPNAAVSTTSAGLRLSQFVGTYAPVAHTVGKSGDATGTGSGTGSFAVTTNSVTVSVSNGVGPFTYSWSHVGGTAATANSSTSASTTFSRTAAAGASYSGTMRCTVTDTGNANLTATVDVTVASTHNSAVSNHTSGVSPSSVSGSRTDTSAPASIGSATTNAAVVSITSGGVGPYTYSWAYVSGDVHAVNSPNSNSTTFTTTDTPTSPATVRNAVYRCTVTDTGNGNYQTTNDVNVQTSHLYDPA